MYRALNYSKCTLLINHRIIESENNLKELEDESKELNEQLADTNNLHLKLNRNLQSGKGLVMRVLRNMVNKAMSKSFVDWKLKTQKAQNAELEQVLKEKLASFNRLIVIQKQLGRQNELLLSENEDLRQTSIEGLEIADVVQQIAREREQLSEDLKDRSLTIKSLLEENIQLQNRLDIAKKCAKELIQLSHQ